MAVKEKTLESNEEFEWNVENEIQLFFAMNGHKPVGVNKYFHMVCIWEKFRAATHKDISLKPIWDHLESMYDLMALDDMEDLPFPSSEVDFNLPETEFHSLMKSSRKKEEPDSNRLPKEQKEKLKDLGKKEKDTKETPKKDLPPRDQKINKETEKKKEEVKKVIKELEIKRDKQRDVKDVKKDYKTFKSRPKGKDEATDEVPQTSVVKKERKDSGSSREELKRAPKRPTRQSIDNTSKASSSPRDTPPLKRRRI